MNRKVIIFGAGQYALRTIKTIGRENVLFIVDNDKAKAGSFVESLMVYNFEDKLKELKNNSFIIAVSKRYENEIKKQLDEEGIHDYITYGQIQYKEVLKKLERQLDYISVYNKAMSWIDNNLANDTAIICTSEKNKAYPEVTGYYIPTLLKWNRIELAIKFATWLMEIQNSDGSWSDIDNKNPYVFDSAQILKGLLAIKDIYPDKKSLDMTIQRGCEWIISNMKEDGRLTTPSEECWGSNKEICSELVHLYCLSPLMEAGKVYDKIEYLESADKILKYYLNNYEEKILNFSLLSHFYAYVMEALLDLEQYEMCSIAMMRIGKIQKESGAIPAYNNCDWVCSTGLFQFALVWFRLGDLERGNKAFSYACKLQNESGGWYGSYVSEENENEENTYLPDEEISWANKYFLDALYYKNKIESK